VWSHEALENPSSRSILVVEEDPARARAIRDRLTACDPGRFEIEPATSLDRAVEALRLSPYAALLIDLRLPADAGWNTLLRAQGMAHRIATVVMTGHPDEEVGLRAVEAGIQEYMVLTGEVPLDLGRRLLHAVVRHCQLQRCRWSASRISSDPVTGLADRRVFLHKLQDALGFAGRFREKPALLVLGLENFAAVRERLGPVLGARLLHEAGRRLTWCVRRADTLGRLEDDEIALLLPHAPSSPVVRMVAERLRLTASAPFESGGGSVHFRASVGAAWCPLDGDTPDQLLRAARAALAEARQSGGGRSQLFRGHDLPPWPEDIVQGFRLPEADEAGVIEHPVGGLP